jgi:hypothetical protein
MNCMIILQLLIANCCNTVGSSNLVIYLRTVLKVIVFLYSLELSIVNFFSLKRKNKRKIMEVRVDMLVFRRKLL